MKGCLNQWHNEKKCKEDKRCGTCGVYTCSANFPYHVCVASLKERNLKETWEEYLGVSTNKKIIKKVSKIESCPVCGADLPSSMAMAPIIDAFGGNWEVAQYLKK